MAPHRDGSRAGLVGGLLASSLVIALLLAAQAQVAVREHRRTAEGVLFSCAALAGEELVRRGAAEVGYRGYMPALEALPSLLDTPGAKPPPVAARVFRLGPEGPRFVPAPPSADVVRWIASHAPASGAAPNPHPLPFVVASTVLADGPHLFVWSTRDGKREGFEVALPALEGLLREALAKAPLLPPALAHGAIPNASLSISVRGPGGAPRFHAGPPPFPYSARVPFGDTYGGVLQGFEAEVSVDPALAPRLVPGGLPRSRLPVLLALFALSCALAFVAARQVRRERDLVRLRESFVAGVSHELRTPLAQIRLFAETLLLGRARGEGEARHALVVIDREARRLSELVENVLAFSRGAPACRSNRAPVDVPALVREVIEGFRPLAAAKGARLEVHAPEQLAARADPGALSQVLVNLLDNAVKYGPRGQTIGVRLRERNGCARLEVEDEGPGVPAAERRRVFERFARLPRDANGDVPGAGIGLAVVRELAESQGGRAFVEDRGGGGARFVVEIPRADASAPRSENPRA